MRQGRDKYQRRVYAVVRMNLAMIRLTNGADHVEREKAAFWIAAWMAISGLRRFKLEKRSPKQS